MSTKALESRCRLQDLADAIAAHLPHAVLGAISDETEVAVSTVAVTLHGGVVLSVSNDLDQPGTHFIVMRVAGERQDRLPFEHAYEDGFGVSEKLDTAAALGLVRRYAALTPNACSLP